MIDTSGLVMARYMLEKRYGPTPPLHPHTFPTATEYDVDHRLLADALSKILDFLNDQISQPGDPQP